MLLAPGLFDYPQTGSCAGFHSFHHALTSVSWLPCRILWEVILVPLLYADDFGCLSPSLVFKRWILVLTGELTPLPSLSPGCLPDCFTRLGILGHMLMRITLSEREDAGCIYRCFQEYYTGLETSLTLLTPTGMRVSLYSATEPYMLFICSNTPR